MVTNAKLPLLKSEETAILYQVRKRNICQNYGNFSQYNCCLAWPANMPSQGPCAGVKVNRNAPVRCTGTSGKLTNKEIHSYQQLCDAVNKSSIQVLCTVYDIQIYDVQISTWLSPSRESLFIKSKHISWPSLYEYLTI